MSNFFGIEHKNVVLAIKDDDGEPTGMSITLLPHDDRKVRQAERKANDMLQAAAKTKKSIPYDKVLAVKLAGHVAGWSFAESPQWNGHPIPGVEFTEDAAEELFGQASLRAIRDQVAEAIEDRAAFTQRQEGG